MLRGKTSSKLSEVKAYTGMVNYYVKFIPNFSSSLEPLYKLLKLGVKFELNGKCKEAFEKFKETMSLELVLVHYNRS